MSWRNIARNTASTEVMLLLESAGLRDHPSFKCLGWGSSPQNPITAMNFAGATATLEQVRAALTQLRNEANSKAPETMQKTLETLAGQLEHARAQQKEEARKRDEAALECQQAVRRVVELEEKVGHWEALVSAFDYFAHRWSQIQRGEDVY